MPRTVYEILLPTKCKTISLKREISPSNGIDTDKDTLTDWEEVNVDTVEVNEALNAPIQCVTQGNQLHENVSKVD